MKFSNYARGLYELTGQVLLANIHSAPSDILSSEEILRLFLVRCVERICMTPVKQTLQVVKFPIPINSKFRGDFGISAGLILVESHIYIHTWPEKNFARLEISSCKTFDEEKVVKCILTFFGDDVIVDYVVLPWKHNLNKNKGEV